MPRRFAALLGIVVLVGLVVLWMWRVYRQHESMHDPDDAAISSVVRLDANAARSVENFALVLG